ncbi:hypothetical protein CVT24_006647 [Panaeolus cyanescens]|uniref:Uncharacterized protein n=1 Tax=Panaeolus cyanescens TaxID=181874 RepID=A0A409YSC0_9AGAR|nr:hypothetical protein CVT24_006647 [Panaeolus cyanescens]
MSNSQNNQDGLTTDQVNRALAATINPIFAHLHADEVLSIRLSNGWRGFIIRPETADALQWALAQLYQIIARSAIAVDSPIPINVNAIPLFPHQQIPNQLFEGLGLRRPSIVDLFIPGRFSPLRTPFYEKADAYRTWYFYQRMAREAVTWIRDAHRRTQEILGSADALNTTLEECPLTCSHPSNSHHVREDPANRADDGCCGERTVRFAAQDVVFSDASDEEDELADDDVDGDLAAFTRIVLSIWSDDSDDSASTSDGSSDGDED